VEVASEERMAFPLPDKPSIAVLPFVNMSEDPKQDYFSDGLTEEIITGLSKVPHLFVIARNSTFTYKGKPVKVKQVAEELGVRYVLEGSFRKAEDRLRVTAQLIDATTGHHLWAERYDSDLKDIFALQDEITMKILEALQVKLTEGEEARVWARGTDNLEAYLKFLQGREYVRRFNKESNALARQMFKEVIVLDPEYAMGYRLLAGTHMMDIWFDPSKSPRDSLAKAIELTQKALALDDSLADAHAFLGYLYILKGQHEKGVAEAERAVALDPNSASAHGFLAQNLRYASRHEEAIPIYEKAMRLNPFPPNSWAYGLGFAYLFTERCEEAITTCERAVHGRPNDLFAHIALTGAYGLCGREEEARATATEILRIQPKFSVEHFGKRLKYKSQADKDRLITALRKAGLK
jgi:adenylate cyclase